MTNIGSDSVTLAWSSPDSDGGMPLTGYVVERKSAAHGGWTTAGTVDPHTLSMKVRNGVKNLCVQIFV